MYNIALNPSSGQSQDLAASAKSSLPLACVGCGFANSLTVL